MFFVIVFVIICGVGVGVVFVFICVDFIEFVGVDVGVAYCIVNGFCHAIGLQFIKLFQLYFNVVDCCTNSLKKFCLFLVVCYLILIENRKISETDILYMVFYIPNLRSHVVV